LLSHRGLAMVVVVVQHTLSALTHLLALNQQALVISRIFCSLSLDGLKLSFHRHSCSAYGMVRLGFLWVTSHSSWAEIVCCYHNRLYCGTRCFDALLLHCIFPWIMQLSGCGCHNYKICASDCYIDGVYRLYVILLSCCGTCPLHLQTYWQRPWVLIMF
jgi:hypothetical protein